MWTWSSLMADAPISRKKHWFAHAQLFCGRQMRAQLS